MAMIGKVRRMFYRQKKSVHEIVRITSLSRNTVRKWLKAPVKVEPKYQRGERPTKLAPYHEALKLALKAGRAPPEAREAHGQGLVHRDQGGRLRGRLQPRHRFHS